MKEPRWRRAFAVVCCAAAAVFGPTFSGRAQSAAPPPQTTITPITPLPPPVTLSPFVISEDADMGYTSTETLSGTRLRAQTRDVASALTIVTAEFLHDIGARDFTDVLDFIPSTASYATHEADPLANGARTGTPFIVRGYRSDALQTNFFNTFTAIDTYNTSRLTFVRGPNSILFGIGNPGGSLGVETNRAHLTKQHRRLDLRVDSFDSFRVALDSNHVLVPKVAALRLDLLHDDRGADMKPSKSRRDSAFLTTTLQPAPATTLVWNAEFNRLRQQIPRPIAAFDWISTWAEAGAPLIPRAQTTTAVNGVEFEVADGLPVFIPGVGAMDWSRMALGARPLVRGARESQLSFGRGSRHRPVPINTYVVGDGDRVHYDSKNLSLIAQQRLRDGFHLELGARSDWLYRENFESPASENLAIKVDANAQLPNGAPNPNAGLPYTEQNPLWTKIRTQINQLRATLTWEKDLSRVRVFRRGLGRFTLAALYENTASHQYLDHFRQVNETPLVLSTPDLSSARNMIRRRVYLRPGVRYFTSDFAPFDQNGIRAGWQPVNTPRNSFTRTESGVVAGQANLFNNFLALSGGVRRDQVVISQTNYTRDARGLFSSGSRGGQRAPEERGVGRPYLAGVVVHALPSVSFFYHRSTNYQAVNPTDRTIADRFLPAVTGKGMDAGIKIAAFDDQLTGAVSYFETAQRNARDSTLAGSKAGWISSIWEAIDPARRPPPGWTDVKHQQTRGIEIQLVANVTKDLRFLFNASRDRSFLADHGAETFRYLAAHYPLWEARAATPVASADGATVGALLARIRQEENDDRQVIGRRLTRVYEWQTNFVGRYQFDRASRWKGFAIGSAFRWRSAPIIGFARAGNALDPTRPFKGRESTNLDAWLDYERVSTTRKGNIRWSLQARVQNVFDDRTLLPWTAEDDGTGRMYIQTRRTPNARNFALSATVHF